MTIKRFTEIQVRKNVLADRVERINRTCYRDNTPESDLRVVREYAELNKELESVEKINVSYMIGNRSYYSSVYKIGKAYFNGNSKMTRSRGYWCIEEIPEITQKMQDEMISDINWY